MPIIVLASFFVQISQPTAASDNQIPPSSGQGCQVLAAVGLPDFPLLARKARLQGTVEVHLRVTPDRVAIVTCVRGPVLLAQLARNAALQFDPESSITPASDIIVIYDFRLDGFGADQATPTYEILTPTHVVVHGYLPVVDHTTVCPPPQHPQFEKLSDYSGVVFYDPSRIPFPLR